METEVKTENISELWEEGEKRIDVIGQNGNEGEHYECEQQQ